MGFFSKLKDIFKKNKKEETVKYDSALKESREAFTSRINKLNKKYKKVNQEYFDEIEEILISADCGVTFTLKILEELIEEVKKEKIEDPNLINEKLFELIFSNYFKNEEVLKDITFENKPEVILVCGVNGVGKTTSIAKLANRYKNMNKNVLLVAGDTFRAGASEQLSYWSKKIGVDIVLGQEKEDPSSVVYKGLEHAKNNDFDLVIIDTAGRIQNKLNLMNELKKIGKVIEKEELHLDETLLVLDATTGQNGVIQAKAFKEILPISGIILTKMDGTSKGGIILSIKDELDIPVRFIGLGEKMEDFALFDLSLYLHGLIIEDESD